MAMCLERELEIEDLRNHPREMIAQLRDALASGAAVTADPKRISFYEVNHCEHVYYIYVSPSTAKVLLLAAWSHEKALIAEAAVSA
jgi:hypothetical protein